MFIVSFFFFLLLSVLGTDSVEPHTCTDGYQPSNYNGERRVPTNCKDERLDCPASWKSGLLEGREISGAIIDPKFLTCHESFTLCGYVPIDQKSGEVLGQSGVTIGAGVDLGSKSRTSFKSLSNTMLDKLDFYFGLKGNLAACAAIKRPLELTLEEANTLTDAIKDDVINEISKTYDSNKSENALPFASVPRGTRTAIVSVWYQLGYPTAYPRFWEFVTKNDWNNAIKELRNLYKNPKEQARRNLIRRNNEADIIEATLMKCNRSVDIVFLIDESGSVSRQGFEESLDFVKNITKAFPNDKLSGNYSTRFGLSTFSTNYTTHFYLSSYTNQSSYISGINNIPYRGKRTFLGKALRKILVDQFTEKRGLHPDVDGLPRILIVVTDGVAEDKISNPVKAVKDKNIVVYAIGIGKHIKHEQLREIASSESHVYTLSEFSELEKFISTITSSTCYESRPVPLKETIITNVAKNTYQYFTYKLNASSNLAININDLSGRTFAYVSRTNPHPYMYDYDVSLNLSPQKHKDIVISAIPGTTAHDKFTRQIYVSVTSDTNSASFTLEGNECDPLTCTEGTNELPETQPPTTNELSTAQPHITNGLPTIQPQITNELPTTQLPIAYKSSACTVVSTKFVVICFGMLIIIFGTSDF